MQLNTTTPTQLRQWEQSLTDNYHCHQKLSLNIDLTRGKPSIEQLALSDQLDGILAGNYIAADGTDSRNYGGLEGLPEARQLGADMLGVSPEYVLAQGNSSLTLMYQAIYTALHIGFSDPDSAWKQVGKTKFICPSPGYDRHFAICEQLGIDMITVPMTATGPDMDQVENLLSNDNQIKGMWCVPKYSNPTGIIYSEETVERIAKLGKIASNGFRVFWDNAYAVHDLTEAPKALADVMHYCKQYETEDSVIQFASTSKITHAGSGIAFIAASANNLIGFKNMLSRSTIGPDKVNQLRHVRLLPNYNALLSHMQKHAALLRPRFACVLHHLQQAFGNGDLGQWENPTGGYFIAFDTLPGLAKSVVKLAAEAGVKLTHAGATFPYGKDPQNSNIRIAPSVPSLGELNTAMEVFVTCVKLASVRQKLGLL